MTTTIVAFDPESKRIGMALATGTLAVGGIHFYRIMPGVGAVVHIANGDPDLAASGYQMLKQGASSLKTLQAIRDDDSHPEYRQVGVLDKDGNVAAYTGNKTQQWASHASGQNYVAMGNLVVGEEVVDAMATTFESTAGMRLEERLIRALEAERDAGGQPKPQRSSFLLVYDPESVTTPLLDLRVDAHREPVGELRRLFEMYRPYVPFYYRLRPKHPDQDWRDELGELDKSVASKI